MHGEEKWFGKDIETEVRKDRAKEGQQNEDAEEDSKNDTHVFSQEVAKAVGFVLEGVRTLSVMGVLVHVGMGSM